MGRWNRGGKRKGGGGTRGKGGGGVDMADSLSLRKHDAAMKRSRVAQIVQHPPLPPSSTAGEVAAAWQRTRKIPPTRAHTLSASVTPGTTSCSMPLYSPSVFSRIITMSMPLWRQGRPGAQAEHPTHARRVTRMQCDTNSATKAAHQQYMTGSLHSTRALPTMQGLQVPQLKTKTATTTATAASAAMPAAFWRATPSLLQ